MPRTLTHALSIALLAAGLAHAQAGVTLKVIGFKSSGNEIGSPLDQAKQRFLTDVQKAVPGLTVQSLEAPPDFDTQLLVDLAAGTAPDIWYQDGSSLARVAASGNLADMRQCLTLAPRLKLNRFFPNVLKIHQQGGKLYGVPDGFTPMVVYYNPAVFKKAGVPAPKTSWSWNDWLKTAQRLTLDKNGRNATNPAFDPNNVVQWGYRVRKYPFEWVYHLWQNGGDVLSPNGKTASGYLDSPASIEALQFLADLVVKYHVAPKPSTLDQLNQSLGFDQRFLKGDFAMFESGHWEMVGLLTNSEYKADRIGILPQPTKKNNQTVFYESGWVINKAVEQDPAKLKAACQFVERATDLGYQNTKAVTGLEVSGNRVAANGAVKGAKIPTVEQIFVRSATSGRPPYGSQYAFYPAVETILTSMMDRILNGAPVASEVKKAVTEINREVGR